MYHRHGIIVSPEKRTKVLIQDFANNYLKKHQKKVRRYVIPKCANWGWLNTPAANRLLTLGVFLGCICLIVPTWAYFTTVSGHYITFGLWHLCADKICKLIGDATINHKTLPTWFEYVRFVYAVGVLACFVALGILSSNYEGIRLHMTSTLKKGALALMGISVLQQFTALYGFFTYFHHLDFLYSPWDLNVISYHAAYFCGIGSCCVVFMTMVMVAIEDSMDD